MVNGFSKYGGLLALLLFCSLSLSAQNYHVTATQLKHDVKDLSQRSSKVLDQNGERCALLRFETPVPTLFTFQLGAQQIEKRENKEDEVWIWVSADVRKMTIACENCEPLRDYRVTLKAGNVYRAKLTTGLPQESSTHQFLNLYCEQTPYFVSIDGGEPQKSETRTFHADLQIGRHELRITAPLYQPTSKTVRLLRSHACNDTVKLEKNYGEIQITANMNSYTVKLDDELQTNIRMVKAEPGTHRLVISKEKYETYETVVNVRLGEVTPLNVKLSPAYSMFNITARDRETEIWVDGVLRGHESVQVALEYGVHTIEGRRTGFDPWEYSVHEFDATSARAIVIPKLVQQFGSARLSVFPVQATMRLDGEEVTMNDGVYVASRIATGKHYVHIRMEDFMTIIDTFTVQSSTQFIRDYQMQHIAMGYVVIHTDKEVAIYRVLDQENQLLFLGKGESVGKMPAGEQTIVLRNTDQVECFYRIIVKEGTNEQSFSLPYTRDLKVRPNKELTHIQLQDEKHHTYELKAHRTKTLEPRLYTMTINRKGYPAYTDTLDLRLSERRHVVYHATMQKQGEEKSKVRPVYSDGSVRHRFYDNAGEWFFGVVDFGYQFDFAHYGHYLTFGLAPMRYKMLGFNLLDAELCVASNDTLQKMNFTYRPKIAAVLPCGRGFAWTFYGGATIGLNHSNIGLLGGTSMQINTSGICPINLYAEYRHPLKGADKDNTNVKAYERFRIGLSFSLGVDR